MMKRNGIVALTMFLAALLGAVSEADAREVTINIGRSHDQAINLLKETRGVSYQEALKIIAEQERKTKSRIVDSITVPDGAIVDYVHVNGEGKTPVVKRLGTGILLGREGDYGRRVWANIGRLRESDPAAYQSLMREIERKGSRNYFVAKLTPEQMERLNGKRRKGDGAVWKIPEKVREKVNPDKKPEEDGVIRTRGAQQMRILVIGCTFPKWRDQSPSTSYYYYPISAGNPNLTDEHPIGVTLPSVAGAGGPFVNNGNYISSDPYPDPLAGRIGPPTSWDFTDEARGPQTYLTDVDFQNRWFNLIFNTTPGYASLYNFLFINSHSKVALSGVLSDIKGWLRTHKHPLDARNIGDLAPAEYFIPFPGTPILTKPDPDNPGAGDPLILKGYSSSGNTVAFYFNKDPGRNIVGSAIKQKGDGTWESINPSGPVNWYVDRARRVIVGANASIPTSDNESTAGRENRIRVTFTQPVAIPGTPGRIDDNTIEWDNPKGQSLTNLFNGASFQEKDLVCQQSDLLQPRGDTPETAHWILSFNYYWHDHVFSPTSSTAYQLKHLRNNSNPALIDDLAGSNTDVNDRVDRPFPYDFCQSDLSAPNGGYFESPFSTGTHNSQKWKADVLALLNAYGFSTAGYQRVFFIFPNSGGGVGEGGSTSFIPNASGSEVVLPEDAGLGLVAHETLHTFGAIDLYDTDGPYYNGRGYQPPRNASDGGIKNYSVMAGGMRVDPITKIICGWLDPIVATDDKLSLEFPSIEDSGSNPVVYKIPVKLPQGVSGLDPETDPSLHEYFLVENHYRQLFGDSTAPGLTIWHVDERAFKADPVIHMGMGDPNFLFIVPIQADGQYDIENGRSGDEGDPFPGSTDNRNWMGLNPPVAGTTGGSINGPNSRSRGITDIVSGQVIPGTDFDTYIRLLNIHESTETSPPFTKKSGPVMVADLYVKPREVIVTGTSVAPATVSQGQTNVAFERLTFTNSSPTDGGGISEGDVNILSIKFKQNGTSNNRFDISRIALFDDSKVEGTFGAFDPGIDPLVAQKSNPFAGGNTVVLDNLNYLVQNGASNARSMFVVYDISETAQVNPRVTVGTEISAYTDIIPQQPGAVRQGPRQADGYLQRGDFPILSDQAAIVAAAHSLVVRPVVPNPSAQTIAQGQLRYPMLRLDLSVPAGQVLISQLNLVQAGNDPNPADVTQAQIYEDTNANGSFDDPNSGGADTLLSSASFNQVGAKIVATFNNLNYRVSAGAPRSWFITYDISPTALVGATVSAYLPGINLDQKTPFTLNGIPDIVLTQPVEGGAISDTVSPANFPIDSGALQIVRTGHALSVKGRDVAPPYADPDVDPSGGGAPLASGRYTGGNGSRLIRMKKLILSAAEGNITVNSIKVDLPVGVVAADIAAPPIPPKGDPQMSGGIMIFEDLNNNDVVDAPDKLVGTANIAPDETSVVVTLDDDMTTATINPFQVSIGTARNLIIALDCAQDAVVSDKLQIVLTAPENVDVSQPGIPASGQDWVEFFDQAGNQVTSLASPEVVIRGFVQIQNTPSNVDKILVGSTQVPMQNLTFKAIKNPNDAGDLVDKVTLVSLKVNKFGSSTAAGDLSKIALYLNNARDTTFDGTETLLQERDSSASGWPNTVVFDGLNVEVPADGSEVNLLITVDVPITATPGVTVGTQLLNSGFINPTVSPNGVIVANSVFPMSSFAGGSLIYSMQPDLLIKQGSEPNAAYAIDGNSGNQGGYQTVPTGDQIESQTAARAGTATYNVKIENDGNIARTFLLKARESAESGWTITYKVGAADVTTDIRGNGYTTAVLTPNASVVMTIEMTPAYNVVGGTSKSTTVEIYYDAADTVVKDAVQAVATVAIVNQPDLLIKQHEQDDTAYAIDGVYQTVPGGDQIETQTMLPAKTATYDVRIENDGNIKRSFVVRATESSEEGFNVLFKFGTEDITGAVRGSGFATPILDQNESIVINVEVTPGTVFDDSTTKTVTVNAYLDASDNTVQDSVQAQTSVNVVIQPDALIKKASEPDSAFAINDVYQDVPSGNQIESQTVAPEERAQYTARIENDGNTQRSFLIQAVSSKTPNWAEKLTVGATDITSAITGSGYTVTLAPGEAILINIEATPSRLALGNSVETITLNVYRNASDTVVRDAVQASTTVSPRIQPDALIKLGSEPDTAFALNDIYQSTPTGDQIEAQSVEIESAATFDVKIENDGNERRTFFLKATETGATGWTTKYMVDTTDVTADITGAGYTTPSLDPGGSMVIRISVTPDATVIGGTNRIVTLQVFNDQANPTVRDAVRAVTTALRPDLLIKKAEEGDGQYAINNVYQSTPAGDQVESTAVNPNQSATYQVRVQNDGDIARTYVVKASETTSSGWTITYRVGDTDISGDLLSANGYTTPSIAAGESLVITIVMTPDRTVVGGSVVTTTLNAYLSGSDTTVRDAVRAETQLNVISQPDLLIKLGSEDDTAYSGNDLYQSTPAAEQVRSQNVAPDATATYNVKIENDGNTSRAFLIKADETTESGWTVTYKVGARDVTSDVRGSGYTTATLAPGEREVLTIEVTPSMNATGGSTKHVTIRTYLDAADTKVRDAVRASTTVDVVITPDALIKKGSEPDSAFALNDVYQSTPSGEQVETDTVAPGVTAVFNVKIENDGNTTRTFVVKAVESGESGWTVVYKKGSSNITSSIKDVGYVTAPLARGQSEVLTVEVTPGIEAMGGTGKSVTLNTYRDAADTTVRDAVGAITLSSLYSQPDLLIRKESEPESEYAIDGSLTNPSGYQSIPAGAQVKAQTVEAGTAAKFYVKVQNDGNNARTFVLTADESSETGWNVSYRVGDSDITSAMRGAGYTTPSITAGGHIVITVTMTPGPLAIGGQTKTVVINAYLAAGESTVRDAVQMNATLAVIDRADLLIKQNSEPDSAFAINNVYQTTPEGNQIKTQSVDAGNPAIYQVKLENDGNTTRSFVLKAAESSESGWTVICKVGDTDITGALRGPGYTAADLAPGASIIIRIEMTPATSVRGDTSKSITINAYLSSSDATVRDAVKAVAFVNVTNPPDALIKRGADPDSAYAGNNIYQTTPAGDQVKTQSVLGGETASYHVKIENDGNVRRTYLVKAVESADTGWTVTYKVGATDVSNAIRSGGYTTPALDPGGSVVIEVKMQADAAATGGASKSTTLNVFLDVADNVVRDAVKAVASVAVVDRPDALIKKADEPDSAYGSNNVYQTSPSGDQVRTQTVSANQKVAFNVKIENDGNTARSFLLKSVESPGAGWTIAYRIGAATITSAVRGVGYATSVLAPGAAEVVTIEMTGDSTVLGNSSKSATINVYLDLADATVRDAVQATAVMGAVHQPDLLIKSSSDPDDFYVVNGPPYETTPSSSQTIIQNTQPGATARFNIKLENDGNVARSFTLKAVESADTGWTTLYRWDSDDITSRIKSSSGFVTPVMNPGASRVITLDMTSSGALPPGSTKTVTITAEGEGKDAVLAAARLVSANRPDLLIKKCSEPDTAFAINGAGSASIGYQTVPTGDQIEQQNTIRNVAACYQVKVENDDIVARIYNLRTEESPEPGWTVVYRYGNTNISEQLRSAAGWTTPLLEPGGSAIISIEMTPDASVAINVSKSATLRVYSDSLSNEIRDAVRATTKVVEAVPPTVTGITPNSGMNNAVVTITELAGSGFEQGATVRLTRSGEADIPGADVGVVSSTKITCKFDLTGKAVGSWNVVVRNPNGLEGMLPNGFTITAPPAKDLAITAFTPSPNPVQRGKTVSFSVTIKNVGAATVSGATFRLVTSSNQVIYGPANVPTLEPGKQISDTIKKRVPRTTRPGDYLITAEVILADDAHPENNKQTVKLTVK